MIRGTGFSFESFNFELLDFILDNEHFSRVTRES